MPRTTTTVSFVLVLLATACAVEGSTYDEGATSTDSELSTVTARPAAGSCVMKESLARLNGWSTTAMTEQIRLATADARALDKLRSAHGALSPADVTGFAPLQTEQWMRLRAAILADLGAASGACFPASDPVKTSTASVSAGPTPNAIYTYDFTLTHDASLELAFRAPPARSCNGGQSAAGVNVTASLFKQTSDGDVGTTDWLHYDGQSASRDFVRAPSTLSRGHYRFVMRSRGIGASGCSISGPVSIQLLLDAKPGALCGNGVLDATEECDQALDPAGCTADCTVNPTIDVGTTEPVDDASPHLETVARRNLHLAGVLSNPSGAYDVDCFRLAIPAGTSELYAGARSPTGGTRQPRIQVKGASTLDAWPAPLASGAPSVDVCVGETNAFALPNHTASDTTSWSALPLAYKLDLDFR